MNEGFLGTAAPRYADLILLLEILMGAGLLIGAQLARRNQFRFHAWCQSLIVLTNFAVIVVIMIPSFHVHVAPKIPLKLGTAYYALGTLHATLGTITEIGALYIVVAAGTNFLPAKLRMTDYKGWMRCVLVGWWLELMLGVATYVRWYVPHSFLR